MRLDKPRRATRQLPYDFTGILPGAGFAVGAARDGSMNLFFSRIKRRPKLWRFGLPATLLILTAIGVASGDWTNHPRRKIAFIISSVGTAGLVSSLGFWPEFFNRSRHRIRDAVLNGFFSPPAVALYAAGAGILQSSHKTYGDKWSLFKQHPVRTEQLLWLSYLVPFLSAVGVFWRSRATARSLTKTEDLLSDFVKMVARIVDAKLKVLAESAQKTKRAGKFSSVTRPDDQLQVIFQHSAVFLCDSFSLTDEQVDFTVLEHCTQRNDWQWAAYYHKCPACAPSDLLQPGRAAEIAYREGQVFIPSKLVASEEGTYWPSTTRNEKGKDGSIFCYKTAVKCPAFQRNYIVSIVTYDQRFCNPGDELNEKKTMTFLREIVRRIEIELHYRSIKAI